MCAHYKKMTFDEVLIMERLFKSRDFERFILGVLYQRENPPAQRNKSVYDGLMTFDACDCIKVGIL